MTDLVERLREKIIFAAFADGSITSGALAERLIRERLDAADEIEKLRERLDNQAEKHIRRIEFMQEKETLHDPYEDGINAGLRLAANIIKESVE